MLANITERFLCARYAAVLFAGSLFLIQQPYRTPVSPVLQMGKLRHREVTSQSHRAGEWQRRDLKPRSDSRYKGWRSCWTEGVEVISLQGGTGP